MFECASLMSQHACGERSDRVQGLSALARFQGARSPLAESEAAPQVDPAKPQRKNPQRSCGASHGVSDAANAAERSKGLPRCNSDKQGLIGAANIVKMRAIKVVYRGMRAPSGARSFCTFAQQTVRAPRPNLRFGL